MRILGIDPGLQITGYGCVDLPPAGDDGTLAEGGVIRLKRTLPIADRLRHLHDELGEVIDALQPQRVVVEQLFSHYRHVRTSILMGHARGVVLLAAAAREIELDELQPTEVKKAITGNGHASKRQMQTSIMSQCGLNELPEPPDVADAIAIALCAARRVAVERVMNQERITP